MGAFFISALNWADHLTCARLQHVQFLYVALLCPNLSQRVGPYRIFFVIVLLTI